jgi:hypothetical protein
MIFDKAKLLSVFDATRQTEPMPYSRPPPQIPVSTRILKSEPS